MEKHENLRLEIESLKKKISQKQNDEHILTNQVLEAKRVFHNNTLNQPSCDEMSDLYRKIELLKEGK